jgi:hypothetical protein
MQLSVSANYTADGKPTAAIEEGGKLVTPVKINGGLTQAPVINTITITATQIELKAGATALDGRKQLIIYPPDAGYILWGVTGLTADTGAKLAAGGSPVTFDIDPDCIVHLYAISDGTDRQIKVVEAK